MIKYLDKLGVSLDDVQMNHGNRLYILVVGVEETTLGKQEFLKEVELPEEFQTDINRLCIKQYNAYQDII